MGAFNSHKLLAIVAALVLGVGITLSVGHARPRLVIHPISFCPYQTPEEWQHFLERYADDNLWVETCEDSPCDAKAYAYVRDNIQMVFNSCAPLIARDSRIEKCTANLRRFVPAWMDQHSAYGYGFTVENARYLREQEAPDKPRGMMTPPRAIVEALPSRERVEEAARRAGLKYLTHDSAIDGTRTFVLNSDPDGKFDQWLLLNLADKRAQTSMPLSILAVQKKDANGRRLAKVRLHFRDYGIARVGNGWELRLDAGNNGKCYACHVNGVRQLIARHTPILEARPVVGDSEPASKDFAYARLMEFNRRLRSYGAPDWDGKLRPENFGPALGAEQGCTDCHNGRSRAALNVATSDAQLQKKVYNELSMPYDTGLPRLVERAEMRRPPLSAHEEKLLRKAFEAHEDMLEDYRKSRLPKLRGWLLETPCR